MYFLLYWLNTYVFLSKSKWVKLEWIPLVKALHSFNDVAMRHFLLAHLYHLLYEMTRGEPFESNTHFGRGVFHQPFNTRLPLFLQSLSNSGRLGVGHLRAKKYPWFSNQIFQDAFKENASNLCKEKFISCIQQRDLAWGVWSDRGYECGLKIYPPNFYGRPLGFRQTIPVPFFDSMYCRTSYRLNSSVDMIFGQLSTAWK